MNNPPRSFLTVLLVTWLDHSTIGGQLSLVDGTGVQVGLVNDLVVKLIGSATCIILKLNL